MDGENIRAWSVNRKWYEAESKRTVRVKEASERRRERARIDIRWRAFHLVQIRREESVQKRDRASLLLSSGRLKNERQPR